MLKVEHLKKRFGKNTILDDISFQVSDGEIVTIIGPSGTGKTTLLRCINFLERANEGSIRLDEIQVDCAAASRADILKICRHSGMVFQNFNLFRNKTVLENVTECLTIVKKLSKKEAYEIAHEQLCKVGMEQYEAYYPNQISGGQQQRVAIARALAMSPSILLLDEPTSALDPGLSQEVLKTIQAVAGTGMTMLIVTHEIEFARNISDRIIFMEQGRIVEEGPPKELFLNPKKERTRQFIEVLYPKDFQI